MAACSARVAILRGSLRSHLRMTREHLMRRAPSGRGSAPLEILQNLARRIVSRQTGDAAARMRAGAAHVETAQRAAVVRVSEHRARGEHLSKIERAVENIAADEPEGALEIERREYLPAEHRALEVRRIAVDRVDHQVGDRLAVIVP